MANILYTKATCQKDLEAILCLQKNNLQQTVAQSELQSEGFVTIEHDMDLLTCLNTPFAHTLAKSDDGMLAGYALSMLAVHAQRIPLIQTMIDRLDDLKYDQDDYIIMGQVCIDKAFRRKGIFRGLYNHMAQRMKNNFKYIITEVSQRNQRSMNAHLHIGFTKILEYEDELDDWAIIQMNLDNNKFII